MYKVIDLFAGAGGLSFGFKKTGKYEITASFEINKNAQKTYIKNYPNTKVFSDVCSAKYDEILKEFGEIDVVIGGPPCQGFSNANRQKNHAVSQNNMLVKEYVRAVREIKPKAFVMENVGMLKSDVHRFYLRNDEEEMIEKYNIQTTESEIRLLEAKYDPDDFADDIKDIKKVREVLWEEDDYKLLNIIFRQRNNSNKCEVALKKYERKLEKLAEQILSKEYSDQYQCFVDTANAIKIYYTDGGNTKWIIKKIEKTIMIQRMLSKVNELFENKLKIERYKNENGISVFVRSYSVLDYLTHVLGADEHGYNFKSGILCATEFGVPQRRNRFVFMGVKKEIAKEVSLPIGTFKEQEFRTVKDAIADLENVPPTYDVAKDDGIALNNNFVRTSLTDVLRDSDILHNHIITKTRDIAMQRFKAIKPGENFQSLNVALKENTYTDTSRTQNTIYQRLRYNAPSGTVVNVRKSMWIHPVKDRAVSIREAARLQTFPDSFIFVGTKDSQYQQVGNAVPPMLAEAIANQLVKLLDGDNNG